MRTAIPTLLFITLLTASIPSRAATFTVNHLADEADVNPGDGICDFDADPIRRCSIRAAIEEAETDEGLDIIEIPPWPDGSPYVLTLSLLFDRFTVSTDVIVRGVGGRVEIIEPDGDPFIFETGNLNPPASMGLRLENLVLTCLDDTATTGVESNTAPVVLQDVEIAGCAIGASARSGGDLEILRSELRVNQLGVLNSDATVRLIDTTLEENINRDGVGGGLFGGGFFSSGFGSFSRLSGSLIRDNATERGGGVAVEGGAMVIVNSTVSGNRADRDGGGIYLFNDPDIHLANTTVAFNFADDDGDGVGTGGGLFNADTADIFLRNTILGNNTGAGPLVLGWDCMTTPAIFSQGHNLIHRTLGCAGAFGDPTNINERDPELFDLADNGGPTLSHEPMATSMVIDAGNPAGCTFDDDLDFGAGTPDVPVTTDQRGLIRPIDGDDNGSVICDIGAVERQDTQIFADGFESGDFGAWSQVVP